MDTAVPNSHGSLERNRDWVFRGLFVCSLLLGILRQYYSLDAREGEKGEGRGTAFKLRLGRECENVHAKILTTDTLMKLISPGIEQ